MFNLDVQPIPNAQNFLAECGALLYGREAEYSLMLGLASLVADRLNSSGVFYAIKNNSQILAAAYATEQNLILSEMPLEAIRALADQLYFDQVNFPGVVGPVESAKAFANVWVGLTEKKSKVGMSQKIYRLDNVVQPRKVKGQFIAATNEHENLVTDWVYAFSLESLAHEKNSIERAREFAIRKIPRNEVFLWLDESNRPVSMNSSGRATLNGISVSAVYTPKEHRKKGYASNLVAQTSQHLLNQGKKFCVLYTDASNSTSNRIYQKIGYNEVATSAHYLFI